MSTGTIIFLCIFAAILFGYFLPKQIELIKWVFTLKRWEWISIFWPWKKRE
jgi:hypothetical protein